MTPSSALIEARSVSKQYTNGEGSLPALAPVSFQVARDEFVCVVGPSGCGKTTLLRLLSGLVRPSQGEVIFEGERMTVPRRSIGFVFQQANLMPWRTVRDNIGLPLELQGSPAAEVRARAQEMIQLVGLSGSETALPRDLSGGMAQRVAIARALIHQPDLLLLDEPFGSLDALTRERMAQELLRIWGARRVTVVMVTHSISEAVLLADRVLVLTGRPGCLSLDKPVGLPRPRPLETAHTETFGAIVRTIREAIGASG
jgi:NitT/TauT family transport system ATP-binding protein